MKHWEMESQEVEIVECFQLELGQKRKLFYGDDVDVFFCVDDVFSSVQHLLGFVAAVPRFLPWFEKEQVGLGECSNYCYKCNYMTHKSGRCKRSTHL